MRSNAHVLAQSIEESLRQLGYIVAAEDAASEEEDRGEEIRLSVSPWADNWSRVHLFDEERLRPLLEELVDHDSLGEMIYCHFKPEENQYSYHLYRAGRMVESFTSGGSGMGSVSFTSDLRQIPLQKLLEAEPFFLASLELFGMTLRPLGKHRGVSEVEIVAVPGKTSFLKRFFGSI